MAGSPRDTYITGLVNAHALENQAVSILSRQAERLESYPEMSEQIRPHIDESKAQAQRLEEILHGLGTSSSTLKDLERFRIWWAQSQSRQDQRTPFSNPTSFAGRLLWAHANRTAPINKAIR